jgi:phosphatidylinositol phosphate synthase
MSPFKQRLFPQSLQNLLTNLLTPLVKVLADRGLHPNSFTVAGLIITSMAAAAFIMGHLRTGGLLILAGGLCDSIDGHLARFTGNASRFGAMFDSAMDRYSEFAMFFGILAYFVSIRDYLTSGGAFLALCGSIMVSYSRARAESLGFESKAGLMQRAERVVFLGLGALLLPLAFKLAIWLVAIFANITALQRIRHACRQDDTKT